MKIETICKRTKHLTMYEMPAKARGILRAMTYNPHFPDAGPYLARLEELCVAMEAANAAWNSNRGRRETYHRKVCRAELENMFTTLVGYVKARSAGNVAIALSSGFQLRKPPLLLPPLPSPSGVNSDFNPMHDRTVLRWDPMHGARLYHVFVNYDGLDNPDGWQQIGITRRAKYVFNGVKHGRYVWMKVRATSAQGWSPFSSPVKCLVA